MKKILALIFVVVSLSALAQTPSFVPRTNNTGSIGTSDKQWGSGYFSNLLVNGQTVSSLVSSVRVTSFNAVTGAIELVAGDGIKITTNGSQLRVSLVDTPTAAVGTNRVYFQFTGITNFFQLPPNRTNIAIWVWGATGARVDSVVNPGGFTYAATSSSLLETQVLSIVVGGGGTLSATSATFSASTRPFPNGGLGVGRLSNRGAGGGGMSAVFLGTNVLIVAGGSGGSTTAAGSAGIGGAGGGLTGAAASGGFGGLTVGGGGTQTNGGATHISSGLSLFWTNTAGSFLLGGDGGITTNATYQAGGGGGGYWGGGGGFSGLNSHAAGGGGSGFITPLYGFNGVSFRGISSATAPSGSELPEYISSAGVPPSSSPTNGNNGLVVIGY